MTRFHYSWELEHPDDTFKTGVSLHGHTWNSWESLSFLPGITDKISPLRQIMHWVEKRYERKWHEPFDYSKGYWTSPVSPEAAYGLEVHQIKQRGLNALVSLTDHDSITSCKELHSQKPGTIPFSLEWTAPYNGAVLHIGVHNIPAKDASTLVEKLREYTKHPKPDELKKLLQEINSFPESLLILNHPLSDQGRVGFEIHGSVVKEFLKENIGLVHALEVNAMQSWDINRRVARIATETDLPIISGGDRHGFEPNGAINLTNAKTFPEFVREIRHEKQSDVLFMPQCRKPLFQRYAENVKVILDDYPTLPGHVFWYDRVFYQCPDGVTRRLSEMFNTRNSAVQATDFFIGFLGLANRIARPISPVFAESDRTMGV